MLFQVEDWFKCKEELAWLLPLHWKEVADPRIPLDVWHEAYDAAAKSGELHIVTARVEGSIVGYHWSIVRPHLHYKQSLTAYTDIYFLHPDHRKGMNGVNLFKYVEKSWIEKGVQRAFTASKTKLDMSTIFERLGWSKVEVVYSKVFK